FGMKLQIFGEYFHDGLPGNSESCLVSQTNGQLRNGLMRWLQNKRPLRSRLGLFDSKFEKIITASTLRSLKSSQDVLTLRAASGHRQRQQCRPVPSDR